MDYRIISDIALGCTETYDAGKQSYWTFCKDTDIREAYPSALEIGAKTIS